MDSRIQTGNNPGVVCSPIHFAPNEILAQIFVECLPDTTLEHPYEHNANNAPLILLPVCSKWRNVALSTPQLWSSLTRRDCKNDIVRARPKPDAYTRITPSSAMEAWLARARALPLTVCLQIKDIDNVAFLLDFKSRIKSLEMTVKNTFPGDKLPFAAGHDMPWLETLNLFLPSQHTEMPITRMPPRLHTMTIYPHFNCHLNDNMPFHQLTHLVCANEIYPLGFVLLLQQAPKLVSCSVSLLDVGFGSGLPSDLTSINLPDLQSLSLKFWNPASVVRLLRVPSLVELSLDDLYFGRYPDFGAFIDMFKRSSSKPLQTVHFTTPRVRGWRQSLLCDPYSQSLKTLTMECLDNADSQAEWVDIFQGFVSSTDEWFPELQELEILLPIHLYVEAMLAPVVAFVQSRRIRRLLRTVTFRYSVPASKTLESRFFRVHGSTIDKVINELVEGVEVFIGRYTQN